jgi:hypothetical protein
MLMNLHRITQGIFRWLVVGILISIVYDLFWFSLKASEYSDAASSDGGMEKSIKKFSLYMAYISFFVRLFVGIVYWKDSLDFDNIMLGKRGAVKEIYVDSSPGGSNNRGGAMLRGNPSGKPTNVFL